jgi:putative ABC transport system substrate-binding protein
MRRREFIAGLGGVAAASSAIWPLAARAQQAERVRRIGVLMLSDEHDPFTKALLAGLTRGLQDFGWTDGRNVRFDFRWGGANADRIADLAKELVGLQPDVIVTNANMTTKAVQRQTQTIAIVFVGAGDPVGLGLVASVARPGGNTTGFAYLDNSIGSKWLELLKETAPHLARVALPLNPGTTGTYFPAAEAAAFQLGVRPVRILARNAGELGRALEAFAAEPNGGIIVSPSARVGDDVGLINRLAVQHRLPAIYYDRSHVVDGGLMSYGPDSADMFRRGASYVDRILRGAKPSELPVQFPARFELVINLKTAKAIGLEIPPLLLARADEVIE